MRWVWTFAVVALFGCAGEPATTSAAAPAVEHPPPGPIPLARGGEEATGPAVEHPLPDPGPQAGAEEPDPEPDPIELLMAMTGSESTSVGGPRDGSLEGAIALPASGPGFRSNTRRRPNLEANYGTVEMIQALVEAARVVHEELPGGELMINDLGLEQGGPIAHHGSHRSGRDVDVLFYLIDREGEPMGSVGAFLDARGRGFDFRELHDPRDDHLVRIDLPRTWRLVSALLEGPHADDVQRIFVVEHLRALLLRHAERTRAPRAARERFAEITCQPGYPHDDHLHIRFYCTVEDIAAGCEDSGPTYRWRRVHLREHDLRPVINRPRRDRPMAPTTTAEEARANAGRMHSRVTDWLERREAWSAQPHPGRPFCR